MASQFYSRYIPPASTNVETNDPSIPDKKRKKSKKNESSRKKPRITLVTELDKSIEDNHSRTYPAEDELPTPNRHQHILTRFHQITENSTKSREAQKFIIEDKSITEQNDEPVARPHGLEPLTQSEQVEPAPPVSAFSILPEWLQNPTAVSSSDSSFLNAFKINQRTLLALQEMNHEKAFAIQAAIFPMLLPGPQHYSGDICISAATGSGKTLAYALPMTEALRDKNVTRLRGLVVVPTRELVSQVRESLELCSRGASLDIGTAVGSTTLKEEQTSLIDKGQRYDPEAYNAKQEEQIDEDAELMNWEHDVPPQNDEELLPNHVVEYSSKVDILICTPGRLVEHIQSTPGFTLHHVRWLVIDEADRLLDESFQQWVDVVLPELEFMPVLNPAHERIVNTFHLLRRRELRKIVLSATMTRDISKLTPLKLRRPKLVVLDGQTRQDKKQKGADLVGVQAEDRAELPSTLHEFAIKVLENNDKPLYLVQLIDSGLKQDIEIEKSMASKLGNSEPNKTSDSDATLSEDSDMSSASEQSSSLSSLSEPRTPKRPSPSPSSNVYSTLIFTKTNEHATRLARLLSLMRPDWSSKISTLTKSSASSKARKTLSSFQKGKISILIASDRASRGLDIPNLAHVINYDIPPSLTSYIHRVGRTARAGKEGRATTLIAENEARWFWNDIARSEKVGRSRKVIRDNAKYEFGDGERRRYEEALETVGKEARG